MLMKIFALLALKIDTFPRYYIRCIIPSIGGIAMYYRCPYCGGWRAHFGYGGHGGYGGFGGYGGYGGYGALGLGYLMGGYPGYGL